MSFTLDLTKAVKNIKKETERVMRGTIAGVSNRIIKPTPVGDPTYWKSKPPKGYIGGTLRGAWNASIGSPDLTKHNKIDKTGDSTAADASTMAASMKIGQRFYLANPQPYAVRVEFGWSDQAPTGMVRNAVMATQQVIDAL